METVIPLSADVQARLRSETSITSVSQCVEELVLNAIDANATCIAVRIDLSIFRIQVVDNGEGITYADLPAVGKRYHTSKCRHLSDLIENLKFNGYRGEALASICNIAGIVDITSRAKNSSLAYTKMFVYGEEKLFTETTSSRPSIGTTVTVQDLFYNTPVRQKSMQKSIELENVRVRLEGIALTHPEISFTLRNDETSTKILQTYKTTDIRITFSQLFGETTASGLVQVNHSLDSFLLSAHININPHQNKSLQFVYVNKRYIHKSKIHKLLSSLLMKSSIVSCRLHNNTFSKQKSCTASPPKGIKQYPIFIVNIKCALSEYDICLEPSKNTVQFKDWDKVLQAVEEMVVKFGNEEQVALSIDERFSYIKKSMSNDIPQPSPHSSCEALKVFSCKRKCTLPNTERVEKYKYGKTISTSDVCSAVHSFPAHRYNKSTVGEAVDCIINKRINKSKVTESVYNRKNVSNLVEKDYNIGNKNSTSCSLSDKKSCYVSSLQNLSNTCKKSVLSKKCAASDTFNSLKRKKSSLSILKECISSEQNKELQNSDCENVFNSSKINISKELFHDNMESFSKVKVLDDENVSHKEKNFCKLKKFEYNQRNGKMVANSLLQYAGDSYNTSNCDKFLFSPVYEASTSHKRPQEFISSKSLLNEYSQRNSYNVNSCSDLYNKKDISFQDSYNLYTLKMPKNNVIGIQNEDISKEKLMTESLHYSDNDAQNNGNQMYFKNIEKRSVIHTDQADGKGCCHSRSFLENNRGNTSSIEGEEIVSCEFSSSSSSETCLQSCENDIQSCLVKNKIVFSQKGKLKNCFETEDVVSSHAEVADDINSESSLEAFEINSPVCKYQRQFSYSNVNLKVNEDVLCNEVIVLKNFDDDIISIGNKNIQTNKDCIDKSKKDISFHEELSPYFLKSTSECSSYFSGNMFTRAMLSEENDKHKECGEDITKCVNKNIKKKCSSSENSNTKKKVDTCSYVFNNVCNDNYKFSFHGKFVHVCDDKKHCNTSLNIKKNAVHTEMTDCKAVQNNDKNYSPCFHSSYDKSCDITSFSHLFSENITMDENFGEGGRSIYVNIKTGNSSYFPLSHKHIESDTVKISLDSNAFSQESLNNRLVVPEFQGTEMAHKILEDKFSTEDKEDDNNLNICFVNKNLVAQFSKFETLKNFKQSHKDDIDESSSCTITQTVQSICQMSPSINMNTDILSLAPGTEKENKDSLDFIYSNNYRFSVEALQKCKVLAQLDSKFILCALWQDIDDLDVESKSHHLLVIFDQHAIDERIKLEAIIEENHELLHDGKRVIRSSSVNPPLEMKLLDYELRMMTTFIDTFNKNGLYFNIDSTSGSASFYAIPSCLIPQKSAESRHTRCKLSQAFVESIVRDICYSVFQSKGVCGTIPQPLTHVFNTQACRSAIMFGDSLTLEECQFLINSLAKCKLPFQCAHGRPSLFLLADVTQLSEKTSCACVVQREKYRIKKQPSVFFTFSYCRGKPSPLSSTLTVSFRCLPPQDIGCRTYTRHFPSFHFVNARLPAQSCPLALPHPSVSFDL